MSYADQENINYELLFFFAKDLKIYYINFLVRIHDPKNDN